VATYWRLHPDDGGRSASQTPDFDADEGDRIDDLEQERATETA
jgi:hypothetical protein